MLFFPAGTTTATRVYGQGGSFSSTTANNGGISASSLSLPDRITLDNNDNLYVTDSDNNRVLFFPAGATTATRVYGQGGDFSSTTANNGGISANSLSNPEGLALDSSGDLYVTDANNFRVLYYPSGSTIATQAYGQKSSFSSNTANNGGISANSLNSVRGLALDRSGNLYVVDTDNFRVLMFSHA